MPINQFGSFAVTAVVYWMFLDNVCLKIEESLPSAKACSNKHKELWTSLSWSAILHFPVFFQTLKKWWAHLIPLYFCQISSKKVSAFSVSFLFPAFSFGPKVLLFLNRITTEVRPWIRKRTEHEEVEFLCIFPKRIMYFYWDLKCTSWEIVIQTNLSRLSKF